MHHIFFIHSSVNGHSGCFHVLAIVNSAAMNTGVHVSFQISVFSRYMPRIGIAGSYGNSVFSFSRNLHTVLHSGCANLHFHQQCRGIPFSPHPLNHIFLISLSFAFSMLCKLHSLPLLILVYFSYLCLGTFRPLAAKSMSYSLLNPRSI